jgi:hypothetical protein
VWPTTQVASVTYSLIQEGLTLTLLTLELRPTRVPLVMVWVTVTVAV